MSLIARATFLVMCAFGMLTPVISNADIMSDIHIGTDGKFVAKNLTVMQKAGNNLFCRATWGQSFVRVILLVSASTAITKNHGEPAAMSDVGASDIIDAEGTLSTASDSLTITPTTLRDTSLDSASKTMSGTVLTVYPASSSFILASNQYATTTVLVASGTILTKGVRSIALSELSAGDKIVSAKGDYDYEGRALSANEVRVYQDPTVFVGKNFQGTLGTISSPTLPTTLTVKIDGKDYTVYLSTSSSVLNKAKGSASLSRFVAGDTIRLYGQIRSTDLSAIDAEVVRDLNF